MLTSQTNENVLIACADLMLKLFLIVFNVLTVPLSFTEDIRPAELEMILSNFDQTIEAVEKKRKALSTTAHLKHPTKAAVAAKRKTLAGAGAGASTASDEAEAEFREAQEINAILQEFDELKAME
jgi:hypothetical protein